MFYCIIPVGHKYARMFSFYFSVVSQNIIFAVFNFFISSPRSYLDLLSVSHISQVILFSHLQIQEIQDELEKKGHHIKHTKKVLLLSFKLYLLFILLLSEYFAFEV